MSNDVMARARKVVVQKLDEAEQQTLEHWARHLSQHDISIIKKHVLVENRGRLVVVKGGPGSGHFGHDGRPGKVGGSQPGKGRKSRRGKDKRDKKKGVTSKGRPAGFPFTAEETVPSVETNLEHTLAFSYMVDHYLGQEKGSTRDRALAKLPKSFHDNPDKVESHIYKEMDHGEGMNWRDREQRLAEEIAEEAGASVGRSKEVIQRWAIDSWDERGAINDMQAIAHEFSNKEDPPLQKMVDVLGRAEVDDEDRAVFQTIYNRTQQFFKEQDIKEVTVFRGLRVPQDAIPDSMKDKEGSTLFRQAPLSSWSMGAWTAIAFSGQQDNSAILSMTIPVERIWSMGLTGAGTVGELEMIVMEGIGDDEVSYRWVHK